jgi:hypothetical protein
MTPPLCFIDTETTSLRRPYRPAGRRIWEIGMIRREPDGSEQAVASLLVDVDLRDADPFALKVGRFHERHPHGMDFRPSGERPPDVKYQDEGQAALTVQAWTHGVHLIGAVPNFEDLGLEDMLYRHGLTPGWHYHLVDVEALAAGKLGLAPPWDSEELSAKVGVDPGQFDRHTALGDACWARAIYDAVLG